MRGCQSLSALEAVQAAYSEEGEEWLIQLLDYLHGNYEYLSNFFAQRLPQFPVTKLEGTYLAWVDCAVLGRSSEDLEQELQTKAHVWFNAGNLYDPAGNSFLRINLACPRSILAEALSRFAAWVPA